jgi:hypothetical protein
MAVYQGAPIQHGIGPRFLGARTLLYRDIGEDLAKNAGLSDLPIAASYNSFVRDLY